MKHTGNWVYHRSSMLTSLLSLALLAAAGVACAIVGFSGAAIAVVLVLTLAAAARLWGAMALHRVTMAVEMPEDGTFPKQTLSLEIEIHNDKLLPLPWLELAFPLEQGLCILPEDTRPTDEWERPALREQDWNMDTIGEKRLSSCLWHETVYVTSLWTAQHRGLYSLSGWRLRTGDGFGMSQVECAIATNQVKELAVYPALVPVSIDSFLQNLWNADTGSAGVLEDPTVIRSTRAYQQGDSLKAINWRLLSRGLPLSVNVYEDIMPRSLCFLFDGESFGGNHPHHDAMEEALSILASLLVELTQAQVSCGLSLSRGERPFAPIAPSDHPIAALRALAGYMPLPQQRDERNHIIRRRAEFELAAISELLQHVGHFYYITYDCKDLATQPVLSLLDESMLTILTWTGGKGVGGFRTASLQSFKKGGAA